MMEPPPHSPEQYPVKIVDIMRIIIPPRGLNDGKLDTIVKDHQDKIASGVKKMFEEIGGTRGIPGGNIAPLLSYYLEYIEIEKVRSQLDLFPSPNEDSRNSAIKAMQSLAGKSIQELIDLGDIIRGRLLWLVSNYMESWRLHEKLERVYKPGLDISAVLKLADRNNQLMKGKELPPGFSMSVLEDIWEKDAIIKRNSLIANMMGKIQR
jgi:hypothetical protein